MPIACGFIFFFGNSSSWRWCMDYVDLMFLRHDLELLKAEDEDAEKAFETLMKDVIPGLLTKRYFESCRVDDYIVEVYDGEGRINYECIERGTGEKYGISVGVALRKFIGHYVMGVYFEDAWNIDKDEGMALVREIGSAIIGLESDMMEAHPDDTYHKKARRQVIERVLDVAKEFCVDARYARQYSTIEFARISCWLDERGETGVGFSVHLGDKKWCIWRVVGVGFY